jgi:hypothetical protein
MRIVQNFPMGADSELMPLKYPGLLIRRFAEGAIYAPTARSRR